MRSSWIFSKNANALKEEFLSEYMDKQINLMVESVRNNPTEAIGKAKELIESCCKTILEKNCILYDKSWDINRLTNETFKELGLQPDSINSNFPAAKEIKSVLGNLKAIALNIATLRNTYGSGHGKSFSFKGLNSRYAQLAVESSIALVQFLWEPYQEKFYSGVNYVNRK